MSGYIRDIVIKTRWDGDDITVVMKPAKFVDLFRFTRYLVDGKVKIPVEELASVLEATKSNVTSLTGLRTHDAKNVTVDELFGGAYFFELAQEIMAEWLAKASPANPPSPGA